MTRLRRSLYRDAGGTMLRAAVNLAGPGMPPWPGPAAPVERWRSWLESVWTDNVFQEAVSIASPDLARQIQAVLDGRSVKARRVRRAALATARYAIRYTRRSTPFGLFAGVTLVELGCGTEVRFGDQHQAITRPNPVELDAAITDWEADGQLMADVEVCVNNLARRQGGRLHVPSEGASEFSLALTPAIMLVLDAARSPIRCSELADKLAAEFPGTDEHHRAGLLAELLRVRLLRSSLRAPATVVDPADPLPAALRTATRTNSAADLRLDATVRLSEAVLTEAETAATVLTRLAMHPAGTPAWRRYADRFTDRYSDGAEVPLHLVIDPDEGLGLPEGFGRLAEPPRLMVLRDRLLLEIAGTAAVERSRSVALSEEMIERLEATGQPAVTPPHLELCVQLQAASTRALDRGDFRLRVVTVSRAAGAMTGRFWHLFPRTGTAYAGLPTVEPGAEPAQLSFHAGRVHADLLTRAPQVLPRLVSVGEFRHSDKGVLVPSDLAVGVRDGRFYLAEAATGAHLELLAPTALNFVWNNYTPPLARFLAEISRAHTAQVTWFDWGAAWILPFLPTLTYRRSILTAARWKVRARDLPGRTATLDEWADRLHAWMSRFRMPDRVLLAEDDQHLPLDLCEDMHLDLLRAHLAASRTGVAVLHDAPPPDADGWIGGRAHSLVIPLRARS
ncbi:lantibiotic dehydratase family protein [Streptosporangium sp. NBC_01755]|uniref:lantibiotic dehydratase family protein n=1 Tax=unclassified Streptosporangium TaxID=2632669 RepID=UPI002DDB7257|nr:MULTISPECIES: lantibiotic dehydratase family protein [unclassified Streptosporangium]WSA25916.1 lantibiotic dehydratase family protein [Streptosporangium sp. NBC_01810]WSD02695.1 lantibiotic dehydratase family protein [Streptosporangium sp. NBC_01755]